MGKRIRVVGVALLALLACMWAGADLANAQPCDSLNPQCGQGGTDFAGGEGFNNDGEPAPVFLSSPGRAGAKSMLDALRETDFFNLYDFGEFTTDYGISASQIDNLLTNVSELFNSAALPAEVRQQAYDEKTVPKGAPFMGSLVPVPVSQGPLPTLDGLGQVVREIVERQQSDPVSFANGELYINAIDLAFPSFGIGFVHRRSYRSRVNYDGPLGHGWDHSYNRRLLLVPEQSVSSPLYAGGDLVANPNVNEVETDNPLLVPDLAAAQAVANDFISSDSPRAFCGHQIMLTTGEGNHSLSRGREFCRSDFL